MGVDIYTKDNCHKCASTKTLLKELKVKFTEFNILESSSAKEFVVSRGHKTVPQVYLGEKLIGNSEITSHTLMKAGVI